MAQKRLMIIGAGWEQAPLLKRAKELGYWILATHSTADAEGFAYADATEILDPRDTSRALALFAKYQMEAVISDNDDYALYTVGIMCAVLGLPGPSFASISNSNNKAKSRKACHAAGVRQPAFVTCSTYEDALNALSEVGGYPVILKPVDNRGNFGVNRVDDESELRNAFFEAVINSHSREFLVEKFIEGTLLTVEGFSLNTTTHIPLAVSSKRMLGGKKRVALELLYPAEMSDKSLQRAQEITTSVVAALGYNFGYTHTEYIIDEREDIWLVESTNRGGGVYISTLIVPAITHLDLLRGYIDMAFGQSFTPEVTLHHAMQEAAILHFFQIATGGKVKAIRGVTEANAVPGVLRCAMLIKPGDVIGSITNDANRHGYVVAVAHKRDEVRALAEQVQKMISIEFE